MTGEQPTVLKLDPLSNTTARQIRQRLLAVADPERAEGARQFFKGEVILYGTPSGFTRELAKEYRALFKTNGDMDGALAVAEGLLRSGVMEEGAVAIGIVEGFRRHFDRCHYPLFDRWVDTFNNWGTCDSMCLRIIGWVMERHGPPVERLLGWTQSDNRWRRRAAAVTMIPSARHGRHHDAVFRIADALMTDEDDMVRKGVGWLLKEASRADAERVIAHLLRWKDRTSRLVLRYACERMPPEQRKRALEKVSSS